MRDHFSAVAADYARYRPGYPAELFAWLAQRAGGRRRAWDCATGNGQAAVGLAGYFDRVVATDASEAQIAHAEPSDRVEYRLAPAEASGLEPASIDVVTVAQALHWLDVDRFYAEARRVLTPGGLVAAWCYNMLEVEPRVNAIVGRYYSGVVGPYWPPERRLLEAGYRTLPFPFAAIDPPAFYMHAEWDLTDLLGYLGTWSASQRYAAARGADPLDGIRSDLAAAWGEASAVRTVRWPLHLRVGSAGPASA